MWNFDTNLYSLSEALEFDKLSKNICTYLSVKNILIKTPR